MHTYYYRFNTAINSTTTKVVFCHRTLTKSERTDKCSLKSRKEGQTVRKGEESEKEEKVAREEVNGKEDRRNILAK